MAQGNCYFLICGADAEDFSDIPAIDRELHQKVAPQFRCKLPNDYEVCAHEGLLALRVFMDTTDRSVYKGALSLANNLATSCDADDMVFVAPDGTRQELDVTNA
jgi:hypothetical protein